MIYLSSPVINKRKNTVRFQINNKVARQIVLSGSFNGWAKNQFLMRKHADGSWSVEIPLPPKGKYQYKFLIDGCMEMEDIENPFCEPDGIHGWNSILILED